MKKSFIFSIVSLFALPAFSQVGFGTASPNSTLDVRGSLSAAYRSFTTATSAALSDNTLVFTGTAATTLTLPDATACTGRQYWVKNASATLPVPVLTVATTSSQTIDGSTSWTLDETNEIVRFVSNGANWYVMNQDVAAAKTGTSGASWNEGGNRVPSAKAIGTISNFDLPFITNNTENMRLATSGYLGVGTTAPAGRLHFVSQSSEAGDDYIFDDYGAGVSQGIYMTRSRGTIAAPADLQFGDPVGWLRFIPHFNGTLGYLPGSSMECYYKGTGSNNLTDLRLFTSDTERVRISETGNVAIGAQSWNATNPEMLLVQAGTTNSFNVISGKGSIDNYLQLNIQNQSNTGKASSDVVATAANGSESVNYIDMGINSGNYTDVSQPIVGGANTAYLYSTGKDFAIGNAATGRNLIFFTNSFNTSDEKMRITSAGNVGIGTTTPADKLSVAGNVAPSVDNTYSLGKSTARWSAVYAANGTIQTSDARLKTNIRPLHYGLKEVMLLQPVRYNWIDQPNGADKIGLIAQDVRKVVPEVVVGDETKENLGMNYAELVPVLINAIKEQQKEINSIQQRINNLKRSK
jgi:hypothetical protein